MSRRTLTLSLGLVTTCALLAAPAGADDSVPTSMKIDGVALASLTPIQQDLYLSTVIQWAADGELMEAAWILDSMPQGASEAGRLRFVELCLKQMDRNAGDSDLDDRLGIWATCGTDARALSAKRLDAELTAAKATPAVTAALKGRHAKAIAAVATVEKAMTAAADADPAIKTAVYELPATAVAAWAATTAADPTLFTTTLTIADAGRTGSRKTLAGCHDKLMPGWTKRVAELAAEVEPGKIPATFAATPAGFQLTYAMAVCATVDPASQVVGTTLSAAAQDAYPWQGVRTAIRRGVRLGRDQLTFDRQGLTVVLPRFEKTALVKLLPKKSSFTSFVRGEIGKVTRTDATVTVEFRSTKSKVEVCSAYKTTGKIGRINDDGTIEYVEICSASKWETMVKTPNPVTVPAALAAGLEVGRRAELWQNSLDAGAPGMPVVVTETKGKKTTVIAFLGVAR